MNPRFEPITGRYLHLDLLGKPHRLYIEEAGSGIPLLCLHTAGSDARQYRGLMNDARVTANFRVIAFDMPWHGKSSPPSGWQDGEYRLTSRVYVRMIVEVLTRSSLKSRWQWAAQSAGASCCISRMRSLNAFAR
jgi:pimeloyl-ACP methyl ester carboxylesterase